MIAFVVYCYVYFSLMSWVMFFVKYSMCFFYIVLNLFFCGGFLVYLDLLDIVYSLLYINIIIYKLGGLYLEVGFWKIVRGVGFFLFLIVDVFVIGCGGEGINVLVCGLIFIKFGWFLLFFNWGKEFWE